MKHSSKQYPSNNECTPQEKVKSKRKEDGEKKKPPMWKVWLLASRPHTLTASLSPVLVGYNICVALYNPLFEKQHHDSDRSDINYDRRFYIQTIQWVFFCILIQLGTNLHNDYADFVKGADTDERVGQARATQKGWLTPSQTCRGSDFCLTLAFAIGCQFLYAGGGGVFHGEGFIDFFMVFIVFTSTFNAVAYTGGPYPLGYIGLSNISIGYSGLGDIFVFIYFGFVATLTLPYLRIRDYLIRNDENDYDITSIIELLWPAIIHTVPVSLLATAIIVVNNLRDRHTDISAQKRTLAVRFGATFCKVEYAILVIGSYVFLFFSSSLLEHESQKETSSSIATSTCDYFVKYLPVLSMYFAVPGLRAVSLGERDGSDLNPFVGGTARVQLLFCILYSISIRLLF